MRIHPVFHISLLEKADPDTPLDEHTEINPDQQEQLYEVERILAHSSHGRQRKYFVKQDSYPHEENTQEPINNLQGVRDLIAQYHQSHPGDPSWDKEPHRATPTNHRTRRHPRNAQVPERYRRQRTFFVSATFRPLPPLLRSPPICIWSWPRHAGAPASESSYFARWTLTTSQPPLAVITPGPSSFEPRR